jgi:dihydrofolate reductase
VIGGAEIFDLFRDRADRIELTEIDCDAEGDTIVANEDGRGTKFSGRR